MPRWEIKNHWVPVDIKITETPKGDSRSTSFVPQWQDNFKKAWAEAEAMASDGWELISVAPETAGMVQSWVPAPNDSYMVDHGRLGQSYGFGSSWTAGYMLVFRRAKP